MARKRTPETQEKRRREHEKQRKRHAKIAMRHERNAAKRAAKTSGELPSGPVAGSLDVVTPRPPVAPAAPDPQ